MRHQRPVNRNVHTEEIGSQKKKWRDLLPIGLLFPSPYRVGMSNLGFQLIYELVNRHPDIVCERIFSPEDGEPPRSIESSRPLSDFPVLFCSIGFEQDLPGFLKMLLQGGVAPLASSRHPEVSAGNPLIIAGGVVCFMNPEPLAPFVDAMVVGEAEPVLGGLLDFLLASWPIIERRELLARMVRIIPALYVPWAYHFDFDGEGRLLDIQVESGWPTRIKRICAEAPQVASHSQLLSPAAEFANLFLVELGRGCSRGCRFCAAGFIYRPPRLWSAESILAAFDRKPAGIDRVGLLGMEMARKDDLARVAGFLRGEGCLLSFSSLRADAVTPELLELLAASDLKTAAIAPDGPSERLRRVINKGITEDDILQSAEHLVAAGVTNLKLYFMIGLPSETEEDLVEMVALVRKVAQRVAVPGRARGRLSTLTLSINPFVPKPWTPFQFHPFAGLAELKGAQDFLRRNLSGEPNLKMMGEKPERAYLQAVLSRGDRRLAGVLMTLAERGGNWRQIFKRVALDPDSFCRRRGEKELLPWEIIDHGVKREYLIAEYHRSLKGLATPPCQTETCRRCGVCHDPS
ncbi:MAG: radical SAM protein [Proteobacteria bacterium]|nr:radical SAM protein [Pseudomonadota bacterium]MBU1686316.1 radical SAM protein [Pseudomonadota bacterium]